MLLRKVGKSVMESFDDLRRRLFNHLPHEFSGYRGTLTFANGSRIIAGHFQNESDIDAYLGLEYDAVAVEEATTLTWRKFQDISTCCRSSKDNWRPRIYATTNPGGVGHSWFRAKFILPFQESRERETRFIGARVDDNHYNNPEYRRGLEGLGDVDGGIKPTLFIHKRCARLIETLPALQHDPNRPEDVLKVDADEDGVGGDDAADALRYLIATRPRVVVQRKLRGL